MRTVSNRPKVGSADLAAVDDQNEAVLNRSMLFENSLSQLPFGITIRPSKFSKEGTELAALLEAAFPDTFEGRHFYKQRPHSRLLAFDEDILVGQVGLELRAITIGGQHFEILGIIDLCVLPERRSKGIASALLNAAEELAGDRDFSILFADDPELYSKHGYEHISPAVTRWFAIENLRSHSVIERDMSGVLMAKPLGTGRWPRGDIDLLGYLF